MATFPGAQNSFPVAAGNVAFAESSMPLVNGANLPAPSATVNVFNEVQGENWE